MDRIPFDEKELIPIGYRKGVSPSSPRPIPIFNTPIAPKDNLMMLLNKEIPFWMPAGGESQLLCPQCPDNIARGLVFEAEKLDEADAGGPDMFGVEWEYDPVVKGSMVRPGEPIVKDLNHWEDYVTFPKVADLMDWAAVSKRNKERYIKKESAQVVTILTGFFERLISFVDFESAALALIDEDQQDAVHRLFDRLATFYDEYIGYYKTYFDCDIINFHDDWGSQRAPFFSISTVREMILPYMKRVSDSIHSRGMKLDLHCCGKNEPLVPAMIEAGVDSWTGQPMNDFEWLYEQYGRQIVLGMPITGLRMDMSEKELWDTIEVFVKKHPYAKVRLRTVPDKTAEFLYEISRKVYCG